MEAEREKLNHFLVQNFNNILRWEEAALGNACGGKLSVTEFHILEAVAAAQKDGQNTMSEVAARLNVTVGTLTTAVKTLCGKGYLHRERCEQDKRMVRLLPTTQAMEANEFHAEFHRQMVDGIMDCLDARQLEALATALVTLSQWFYSLRAESNYLTLELERF